LPAGPGIRILLAVEDAQHRLTGVAALTGGDGVNLAVSQGSGPLLVGAGLVTGGVVGALVLSGQHHGQGGDIDTGVGQHLLPVLENDVAALIEDLRGPLLTGDTSHPATEVGVDTVEALEVLGLGTVTMTGEGHDALVDEFVLLFGGQFVCHGASIGHPHRHVASSMQHSRSRFLGSPGLGVPTGSRQAC